MWTYNIICKVIKESQSFLYLCIVGVISFLQYGQYSSLSWFNPFLSRTEGVVLESRERRKQSLQSEMEGRIIDALVSRLVRRLEVPLRAFC